MQKDCGSRTPVGLRRGGGDGKSQFVYPEHLVISWASLLTCGREDDVKFPSFNYVKEKSNRRASHKAWRYLLNNFHCMASGVHEDGSDFFRDSEGNLWCVILFFAKQTLKFLPTNGA